MGLWVSAVGGDTAALVLVPTASSSVACERLEPVASIMATTPGVRLVRKKVAASLEEARLGAAADIAVDTRLQGDVHVVEVSTSKRTTTGRGPTWYEALNAAWPKTAPTLSLPLAATYSPVALSHACAGRAEAAYAASGAAIADVVARLVAPPPTKGPQPLLRRWATARGQIGQAPLTGAVRELRNVLDDLRAGHTAPSWFLPGEASAVSVIDDAAVVFGDGVFTAIDLATGRARWRQDIGTAEPTLRPMGPGLWLAVGNTGLTAINPGDGTIRWRARMTQASPDVARIGGTLFASSSPNIVALDAATGEQLWTFDPLSSVAAGPLAVGERVAVGVETELMIFEQDGTDPVGAFDIGDEVAAELVTTGDGLIWTIAGGTKIVAYDGRGEVPTPSKDEHKAPSPPAIRFDDILGASWPPVVLGRSLVVAGQHPARGPYVAVLDPDTSPEPTIIRGALAPVVALADFSGIVHREDRGRTVIARDHQGNARWRRRFGDSVEALEVLRDRVWVAVADRLVALDARSGAILTTIELDAPIVALAVGPTGGAAIVESGGVYGLPGGADPRPRTWLHDVRFDLARAYLAAGQPDRARGMAEEVLARDPDDLDALAMLADARALRDPNGAAAMWTRLARNAPAGDPLQSRAIEALGRLVGLTTRVRSLEPIEAISTSTDGAVIARTAAELFGIAHPTDEQASWSIGPAKILGRNGALMHTGTELIRARDGEKIRSVDPSHTILDSGIFLLDGDTLVREDRAGRALWSRKLEQAELRVIATNPSTVFVAGATDSGIVHALDLESGRARWMRPFNAKIDDGVTSGDGLLLRTTSSLIGVAAATGEVRFRANPPSDGDLQIFAIKDGWMLASQRRILLLDGQSGKPRRRAVLPRAATQLAVAFDANRAFATFSDGAIVAIDLETARIGPRVVLGPFSALVAGPDLVAACDSDAVWVFDATRALTTAPTTRTKTRRR